jgi:hypothetical protein
MAPGRFEREPFRSRALILLGAVSFAAPPPASSAASPAPSGRRLARAATLVYVAVAVALLTAAAELAITIVFPVNLLAAERAIAAAIEAAGDAPPNGGLEFTTDTVAFARA